MSFRQKPSIWLSRPQETQELERLWSLKMPSTSSEPEKKNK